MNFYSVKIGTNTRRGHFQEMMSFVCKSEELLHQVRDVISKQYDGLAVDVSEVKSLWEDEIKSPNKSIHADNSQNQQLRKKVQALSERLKEEPKRSFKSEIHETDYPDDVRALVSEIKDAERLVHSKTREAASILQKHIKTVNKGRVRQVDQEDGFYNRYDSYSYVAILNGVLIEHRE